MIRPAVTTLVMHPDTHRVLMGRRSGVGAFANHLAFPGGAIDEADAADSWGETYRGFDAFDIDERARRVAAARELREETGIKLQDLTDLQPVSRWITPEGLPVRFDTWFYILELPAGETPIADGRELLTLDWVDPRELLADRDRGEALMVLPTLAHLAELVVHGSRWRRLAADPLSPLPAITPRMTRLPDGSIRASIDEGLGFSVTESVIVLPN